MTADLANAAICRGRLAGPEAQHPKSDGLTVSLGCGCAFSVRRGVGRDRPEAARPPGSRAADGEAGGFNAVQKLLTNRTWGTWGTWGDRGSNGKATARQRQGNGSGQWAPSTG